MKSITVISAGALMLLCGNLMANDPAEVKVEARHIVSKPITSRSPNGFPMQDLSLAYGVSLAGLDLATSSGATEAEKRVNAAALVACREIGRYYPFATPSEDKCASDAARDALVKVHQLVAAAEAKK